VSPSPEKGNRIVTTWIYSYRLPKFERSNPFSARDDFDIGVVANKDQARLKPI